MFQGNALSSIDAGHYFYIGALAADGFGVMTNYDMQYIKGKAGLPSVLESATEDTTLGFLYGSSGYSPSFTYTEYNSDGSYTDKSVTQSEIQSYITHCDEKSYNDRTGTVTGIEKTIRKIQASKYGCLKSGSGDNVIKIYFHKKHYERIDRVPSFKGSTLFTAHPRRQSGAKYAFKQSHVNEEVGVYVGKTNISESNYASMVSAPLRLIYNHNQGVWETSSSFLCTLLEPIDGAQILSGGLSKDNLENRTSSEFYGADAASRMWDFNTGLAAPLSVHDNNPRYFGPNLIKFNGSTNVEKIRVVNRTTANFDQGEIALVQQMNGENVLIKMGGEGVVTERPPSYYGPWLFAKFLASSDEYFMKSDGNRIFAGDEVIDFILDRAAGTNTNTLNGYYQETISSTLAGALGDRLNVSVGTPGNESVVLDDVDTDSIKLFWGPLFSAGMTRDEKDENGTVTRSKFQMPAETYALGPFTNDDGEYDGSPTEDCVTLLNKINNYTSTMFTELVNHMYSTKWKYTGIDPNTGEVTSPNLKPVDPNIIQFSFLSADLYGHMDVNTRITDMSLTSMASKTKAKDARNFYDSAAQLTGLAAGTPLFDSTFPAISATNPKAWEHIYTSAPTSYTGPKYDAYVSSQPKDKPQGAYDFFGDNDNDFCGANAVGLTCGRRLVYKKGAWTLNVDTEQVFGTQGEFYGGGGGGGITLTILPFIGGWVNDTRGRSISGTTVAWGSSLDRLESFGTGALHVQVWDGWPREYTLWLAQYAQPLHFNPGINLAEDQDTTSFTVDSWNISEAKYEEVNITVDNIRSTLDYRVPTYVHYVTHADGSDRLVYNQGQDGTEAAVGNLVGKLRPKKYWKVATHRRNQFVTKYGYKYNMRTVGLSSGTVADAGTGFQVDDVVQLGDLIFIKVTAVTGDGGISTFQFVDTGDSDAPKGYALVVPDRSENSGFKTYNYKLRGANLDPESFPIELNVPNATGGDSATIKFSTPYIWDRPMWDYGPKAQSPMTRASLNSGSGQKRVTGYRSVQIGVTSNEESPYPGEYEIFTYCHNDIGIFLHREPGSTTGYQMHNYIKATFS